MSDLRHEPEVSRAFRRDGIERAVKGGFTDMRVRKIELRECRHGPAVWDREAPTDHPGSDT